MSREGWLGAGCAPRLVLPFLQLPPLPLPRLPLPKPRVGFVGITGTVIASTAPVAEDKCPPQKNSHAQMLNCTELNRKSQILIANDSIVKIKGEGGGGHLK